MRHTFTDMTTTRSLIDFQQHTAATGKPFELLGTLGGSSAQLRFIGMFAGDETLWNARVLTLEAAFKLALESGDPPAVGPRQFIDIGADGAEGRNITIGLHVPSIDEPTIWKTITMIRNYKRLRFGRIEWGQEHLLPHAGVPR